MSYGISEFIEGVNPLILSTSIASFILSVFAHLKSRQALRITKSSIKPFITVEVTQWGSDICCVTARNTGASEAHDVYLELYRDTDVIKGEKIRIDAKPFWRCKIADFIQRGSSLDIVEPDLQKFGIENNQMLFKGAFARCRYKYGGKEKQLFEMRVRGNSELSAVAEMTVEMSKEPHKKMFREILEKRGRSLHEDATWNEIMSEMRKPVRVGWQDQTNLSSK